MQWFARMRAFYSNYFYIHLSQPRSKEQSFLAVHRTSYYPTAAQGCMLCIYKCLNYCVSYIVRLLNRPPKQAVPFGDEAYNVLQTRHVSY